jgi:hypothetical protein
MQIAAVLLQFGEYWDSFTIPEDFLDCPSSNQRFAGARFTEDHYSRVLKDLIESRLSFSQDSTPLIAEVGICPAFDCGCAKAPRNVQA